MGELEVAATKDEVYKKTKDGEQYFALLTALYLQYKEIPAKEDTLNLNFKDLLTRYVYCMKQH